MNLATGAVANDGQGSAESVAEVERVEGANNQANALTGDGADNTLIGGLLADVCPAAAAPTACAASARAAPPGWR